MQKIFFIVVALLGFCFLANAQNLYMPRNIKLAYEKGTRSPSGNPGKNYWQNKGKYDISVELNPKTRMVAGFENILYENNSPDTLQNLAIRFVNNVHKPTVQRVGVVSEDYLTSGLNISLLKIDGEIYSVNSADWGTVHLLKLNKPLMPKSRINIDIAWNYPLSKISGREGQIDSTSFFVGYSYPRISVYDDYNGWDLLEHTGLQEFYNDFNDYTFSVKVPKNYVVWATGNFLNPEEVLLPNIAERLKNSATTNDVIHIATYDEMRTGKVTQPNAHNVWKFAYNHISDFTFAVSNHYVWDAGSSVVDKSTGRRAGMQAAYNHTAKDFENAVNWGKNTFIYYSNQMPGIPYPYPKMSAFHGFGDMEFPMMVNDETVPHDLIDARMLQDHEMAHTYFPFYMGINETRYAFMDEGWAVFFTYMLSCELFGKQVGDSILKNTRIKRWNTDFSSEMDMPLITMSSQLSGKAYRNNSYNKSVASYVALKELLGDEIFKKALHHYMKTWNGKHPTPWDFFNCINQGAEQNLNWFWQNWFFTNNFMDLKIANVIEEKNFYRINIQNIGGLMIPCNVRVYYSNGTFETGNIPVNGWLKSGIFDGEKSIVFPKVKNAVLNKIEIDNGVFADATPQDNFWIRK